MAIARGARLALIVVAVLAVVLVILVMVFTRTEYGVERTGRLAVAQIQAAIEGELEVERITSGRLLEGVTLHGVTIVGPDSRPFVSADSARLTYRFRTLLGGAFVFDRLILYSPDVVIERLPGQEEWNYERIFPPDTAAQDTARADLVLIRDLAVSDGRVTVRMPWEPDGPVEPEDTARLILESVPDGIVQIMRFTELNGRFPRVVWEAPDEEGRLIEIGELSGLAHIWETPTRVDELEGVVVIRDSLVTIEAPHVRLPRSQLGVVGRIILGEDENRYDIQVSGHDLALADFQWLYPALPDDGGGTLQLRIQSQGPGEILWLARDARLRTSGSEVAGSFGVVTGDTLYFTNVALEASPLDLELLQQLVPTELELEGLLIGTVEVEGPISALDSRGDVRLRTVRNNGRTAESAVRWVGTVGGTRPHTVRGLEAQVRGLDLGHVAELAPGLHLRGTATGRVAIDGSLERGLELTGDVALDRDGHRSAVRGSGRFVAGGDRSAFDLRFDAEPVALELLVEQFPGLGRLAGEARGPVTVTGTLDDLRVEADIETPAGGVRFLGAFALTGPTPHYRAEGAVTDFELHRVAGDLPETVVTGRFDIDGQGDRRETVEARGSVEVLSARVAGVEIGPSAARGAIADGLLRLDSLVLATEVGEVRGRGSFGLVDGRQGELTVLARARALNRIESILFPELPSAAFMTAPEFRLAGEIDAELVVTGSTREWGVRGRAAGRDLVYDRLELAAAAADFDWSRDSVSINVSADSLVHEHRRAPHVRATVGWSSSGGRLVGTARGLGPHRLDVEAGFRPVGEMLELRLSRLDLVTEEGQWAVADTVHARVGLDGVALDSLVILRGPRFARLRIAGSLPWRRPERLVPLPADLVVAVDSVRIRELLRVAQVDTVIDGVISGQLRLAGTALAPELTGRLVARPFRYAGAVLDSAGGEVSYAAGRARTRFAGWQAGNAVISGLGTVPVDLALTRRYARFLDEPVDVRVQANSFPAGLVSFLAPGFMDVTGTVHGALAVVGTSRDPALEGELRLVAGSAFFAPLNVGYRRMNATARMGAGRVVEVDARIATADGTGHIVGTLDVTRPRDPALDLTVTARELDAARRHDVVATVTGEARVAGRYTRPFVSGDMRIIRGEMNLDEIWRQSQIVQLDPALFQLFDSTSARFRPPPEIPFLNNLVLTSATITADRGFWLRSRDLNVEVSGSLGLEVDRQARDLRLTGALQAIGGQYALHLAEGVPGRTFEIRGGTIDFLGTPGIDPDLEMEAAYRVRRPQGDPIDVVAQVSGRLKDPRVALTSDSDLPMSESDLASYILFGRSGAELTQAETDVVSRGIGLVRPVATGLLSSEIQRVLSESGLPVDYVAFSTPEYGLDHWQDQGLRGVFHNTQFEVGFDAGRDLSLVGSVRIPTDRTTHPESNSGWRMFGARVEWRFRPTWMTELYIEDRFARTPSFGLTEIDDRKVWGLSLVRDWGY